MVFSGKNNVVVIKAKFRLHESCHIVVQSTRQNIKVTGNGTTPDLKTDSGHFPMVITMVRPQNLNFVKTLGSLLHCSFVETHLLFSQRLTIAESDVKMEVYSLLFYACLLFLLLLCFFALSCSH